VEKIMQARRLFHVKSDRLLACIIHKYCRALACSFIRNESFLPQGAFSTASSIHLVSRP